MARAMVVPATDTQVSSSSRPPSVCDVSVDQLTSWTGYARQEREYPQEIPTKPPYTAHLGNLSYDATQESVTDFFAGCDVVSVRIVEDRAEMRPKGFGYAEFATADGLKKALELEGQSFEGRNIRIRIADPRAYHATTPILILHRVY
jgi:translation initiation factor 4B